MREQISRELTALNKQQTKSNLDRIRRLTNSLGRVHDAIQAKELELRERQDAHELPRM